MSSNASQNPHHIQHKCNVIDYFVDEYKKGRTPNPCIACNRYVKWESLLKRSLEIGADYIATGHYARIHQLPNGRYTICNSVTARKDQTYALYNLTQEQLSHTLLPIGDYTKDQVREIASKIGITVAKKPDSMEICFIPDNDYAGFITRETGYTSVLGKPAFVVAIRHETNEVVIGDNSDVFSPKLYANNLNFMSIPSLEGEMRAKGKIRYSHEGAMCTIRMFDENTLECTFDEPVRAVTPGQALVLYDGDNVLGGGTII